MYFLRVYTHVQTISLCVCAHLNCNYVLKMCTLHCTNIPIAYLYVYVSRSMYMCLQLPKGTYDRRSFACPFAYACEPHQDLLSLQRIQSDGNDCEIEVNVNTCFLDWPPQHTHFPCPSRL